MNVIDRARERIERDGWWKRGNDDVFADRPRATCMMNALHYAAEEMGSGDWRDPEYWAAVNAIKAEVGALDLPAAYQFNDDPSTSLEDVLLVLKRASARLDEAAS